MNREKITHRFLGSIIVPEEYNADTFIDYLCGREINKHYACNGVYSVHENDIRLFTKKPHDTFKAGKEYDVCICHVKNKNTSYQELLSYVHSLGGLLTGVHGAGVFYMLSIAPLNTQYVSLDHIENLPEKDGHIIISRVCESDGHGCFYSSLSTRPFKDESLDDTCCYLTFIPKNENQ